MDSETRTDLPVRCGCVVSATKDGGPRLNRTCSNHRPAGQLAAAMRELLEQMSAERRSAEQGRPLGPKVWRRQYWAAVLALAEFEGGDTIDKP